MAGRRPAPSPAPAPSADPATAGGAGGDDFTEVGGAPPAGDDFAEVGGGPETAGGAPASPVAGDSAPTGGEDFQIVMGTPGMSSRPPLERLDAVERALDESIRHIERLDRNTEAVTQDIGSVKESISRMEANMRELTSLYDLISTQMNPFVDSDMQAGAAVAGPSAEELPEYDALFEPTPELAAEGKGLAAGGTEVPPLAPPGTEAKKPPERAQRGARLSTVGSESTCLMAMMHWVDFLEARVRRDHIPSLLGFYVKIGWISEGIRRHVIEVIRGVRPAGMAAPGAPSGATGGGYEAPKDKEGDVVMAYGKEKLHEVKAATPGGAPSAPAGDDWRLNHRDHLTTLIFIEKIRGSEVDRDKLEELERDVARLQKGLEGFYGL